MSAPTVAERLAVAGLAAEARWAATTSSVLTSPFLSWQLMRPLADELLFVPSDLRPADPSIIDEISAGQLGLAGLVVEIGRSSPFSLTTIDPAWARELHGFAWLGSLRAAGSDHGLDLARHLVADWCRRYRGRARRRGVVSEPQVMARRVISWVVGAGFLLEDADAMFYRLFTRNLGLELRALDAASRRAAPGYPRLVSRMALLLAGLAVKGHDRELARIETQLLTEIGEQVLPDGGHISRNGEIVVDVLLDLLPIRQCYAARGLAVPRPLVETIDRMLAHVRMMSPSTGDLARFNGAGSSKVDAVSTVLALESNPGKIRTVAPGASGYARLYCENTVVIVDCGRPPPLVFSSLAHAGCLSFEMAHAGESLIVNAGAPGSGNRQGAADARATDSHSTLSLDDQSSARLIRARPLERLLGSPAISGPDVVTATLSETDDQTTLMASHNGYVARMGLVHERRLALSADGQKLSGIDILRPPRGTLRLARDVPLAIRFHISIKATVEPDPDGGIRIMPPGRPAWRFASPDCRATIETRTDYSQTLSPGRARQIVLRAACPGETTIAWYMERL